MLKLVRALLGMLLIGQGAAFAQTSTAAKPAPSVSTSTATTATKKPPSSGEIYRWVDKNGKVQYGTDVPEESRAKARKVDTRSNIVSSQVPASISGAPQPMPSADAPTARVPTTAREKCEAAWRQYNDSQACFASYRQGTVKGLGKKSGSNISDEALEKCHSITEPAPCR
ncbi:MAG: DUF4124 domain-containing protein [Burkholderiales bacterium]|nr:MAG: DUF4124 domain-containing protein [Burkholderiales bacterium]